MFSLWNYASYSIFESLLILDLLLDFGQVLLDAHNHPLLCFQAAVGHHNFLRVLSKHLFALQLPDGLFLLYHFPSHVARVIVGLLVDVHKGSRRYDRIGLVQSFEQLAEC